MKKLVALTGSGISAESGLKTFRDSGGLWEGYDIAEVASPEGWEKNPAIVLDFYNQRRKNAFNAKPNKAHRVLVHLESFFSVTIITQNVDNLHEKAGSSDIIHLHGELFKSRSTMDESLVYDINGWELKIGDFCEKGSQLRPNIVWFGEKVPMMDKAIKIVMSADLFMIIGTSLAVYPAARLIDFIKKGVPVFVIDPKIPEILSGPNYHIFEENASLGMEKAESELKKNYL